MSTVALRRSLILRACESFDFRSKSHQIWGESLEFCTTSWGSGGMTAKDSHALRMIEPGLEGQPERRETGKLGAPGGVEHLSLGWVGARLGQRIAWVPGDGMA